MLSNAQKRLATLGTLGLGVVLAIALTGRSPKAVASDRVPTDPNEVLERGIAPARSEAVSLKRALANDPRNLRAAVRLARLDIQLARERSDPRYLGQAEAALAAWWTEDAPAVVLVLRATIEQSLHDFPSALRHLDRALAKEPDDVQAWLTRAVVLTVLARYEEARSSCEHVTVPLALAVCETQIDSLTGKARAAYERLSAASGQASRDEEAWALSSLGEYAARFGDAALAEKHFRAVLAIAPEDAYVRAALADLLIDAKREAEAADLVRDRDADDGMLLRSVLAAPTDARIAMLAERYEASHARGDVVHRREEARFALFRGERDRAYELARANFDVQREPWDVRVLLQAARTKTEAGPALEHLGRTNLEDPILRTLAARFP
jgi:Tfp pilus assembly protein PilF